MKTNQLLHFAKLFVLSILIVSCQSKSLNKEQAYIAPDSISSSISNSLNLPSNKKFIRTSESKFKVQNVKQTSDVVQQLTKLHGGYISDLNLKSDVYNTKTLPISSDSLWQVTEYAVSNIITIRVPTENADDLLRDILKQAQFIDNYSIKADEITLLLQANAMKMKRLNTFSEKNKANFNQQKSNLKNTVNAENILLENNIKADEKQIEQLDLEDKMNLSTISLEFYQPNTIQKTTIFNTESVRSPLYIEMWEAAKDGIFIFKTICLFLIKILPLLVLGIGLYFLKKKYSFRALSKHKV